MSWKNFDRQANRFANLLLSRGVERGAKVGILLMNCLEWLPVYFGSLKAGCIAVPLNFRYSSEEIGYCLGLADVEALVFGPEFIGRMDPLAGGLPRYKRPQQIIFAPVPRNPTGKIEKPALREKYCHGRLVEAQTSN